MPSYSFFATTCAFFPLQHNLDLLSFPIYIYSVSGLVLVVVSLETLLPLCSANCWVCLSFFSVLFLWHFLCGFYFPLWCFRFVWLADWRGGLKGPPIFFRVSAFIWVCKLLLLEFFGDFPVAISQLVLPHPHVPKPLYHANFDSFVKSFYCDLLQLQVQVL